MLISANVLAQVTQMGINKIPIYLPSHDVLKQEYVQKLNSEFHADYNFSLKAYQSSYQQTIKNGTFGIYFVPPHFASWLIHQYNFIPVLTLNEPLSYVIASRRDDRHIFELSDLSGKNVCLQAPLSLDYLFFKKTFANYISTPYALTNLNAEQSILTDNHACDAFIINNHAYHQLDKQNPGFLIKLGQSDAVTNYSFVAHSKVDQNQISHLRAALINHQVLLQPLLKTVAKRPKLIKAHTIDFPKAYLDELFTYWLTP